MAIMPIRTLVPFLAAAAVAVTLAGCKGATQAGTPYTQLFTRELESYLEGRVDVVHTTARRVLEQELAYTIYEDSLDAMEGVLRAETARGRTVKVETFRHGENLTRIQVWASPAGDKELAGEVLSRIESAL
ncbi:MAG: DUF3568 family protein [Planctomycetota bacterium]|jgi:hypothetical protein